MSRRRQAGAVDEGGVGHAQLGGPLVHPLHEGLLAAGDVLGQSHGGVIARHHRHRLDELLHAHLLPLLQVDLGAPHGGGPGGDGDRVGQGDAALVQGLHRQQQGHDLGDAGRFPLVVGALLTQHRARLLFHQDGGGRLHLGGAGGQGGGGEEGADTQQSGEGSFHHGSSPPSSKIPVWKRMWRRGGSYAEKNVERICREERAPPENFGRAIGIEGFCPGTPPRRPVRRWS